jgi:predicted TIM-barrel fold metal-dependent hydrolase
VPVLVRRALLLVVIVLGACVTRAPTRLRKVDVHTHFGPDAVTRVLALMDAHGIDQVWNLSGSFPGGGLEQQLAAAARAPGRIVVFANLDWRLAHTGPGYGARMAAQLRRARELGARGLKIPKALGLAYTDANGQVIPVDDPELDPVFAAAGELGLPVAIHTGDPVAFFQPARPANERWDELQVHPGWSFYGRGLPSWEELFAQLERRIARHPGTTFISVHFGNAAEYPERVAALLDRYPNLYVDTAARIPELGRHDADKLRQIFIAHEDRILFGTDLGVGPDADDLMLGSSGATPPTPADVERFFNASWRFFETADRAFPHPTPIQGRWTIDGIRLPPGTLARVYARNAEGLLERGGGAAR